MKTLRAIGKMEKKATFLTQITRPMLAQVFPRNRLFDLLDHALERSVIWISGAPGYGKTTLVSSYIEARKLPCLWYEIDGNDADTEPFFYSMAQTAEKIRFCSSSQPLNFWDRAEEIPPTSPQSSETFCDPKNTRQLVVFDDYQRMPPDSRFHEHIRSSMSRIPERVHLIFISRKPPPPAMIQMLVTHQMEVTGGNALRLSGEESYAIIQLRMGKALPKEIMHHLYAMTDGWIAGLVLMLFKAKTEGGDCQWLGQHIPEEIFDYFSNEIFEKADDEVQDFLLRTAFLPRMTPAMPQKLTGHPHSRRVLSEFNRNHYFTDKFFRSEVIYQYHPLFRAFLMRRAKAQLSPKKLAILYRDTATLLDEAAQAKDAAELLHDVGDWHALVQLTLKHAPFALAKGRNRLLEKSLQAFPERFVEKTPWLLYWMAACRLPFDPAQSRNCFESAFEQFRCQDDLAGVLLAWSGIIDAIGYGIGGIEQFDRWIRIIDEMMADTEAFPSDEIKARVESRMLAALVLSQPPRHSRIEALAAQMRSSGDCRHSNDRIQALFHLALYRIFMGDFGKADEDIRILRQMAQCRNILPLARLRIGCAEAMYYQFMGMHEECCDVVSDCLELSQRSGLHIMDCILMGQSVSSVLNANEPATARSLLKKMNAVLSLRQPWEKSHYHFLKAREALFLGYLRKAASHANMALDLAASVGSLFPLGFCHLINARILHELGNKADASQHLRHASDIARQTRSQLLEFNALMTEALFGINQKEEPPNLWPLREALSIGKTRGYLDTFLDRPDVTTKLCIRALDAGIATDYVQHLIRKHRLLPHNTPLYLDNWPWAVKIFTLGRFSVVREGKPVQFSGKASQKPLTMLKTLIALGGREVRGDSISDALWPDADGDMAHKSFATTLHRLRRLLGDRKVIRLRDGRLTMDQRYCWVDAWAFERTFGTADIFWRKGAEGGQVADAVDLTRKAIDIYKVSFLARESRSPWAISLRERLRSKFSRGVRKLGHYWEQHGHWEKAVECYQRGLEVESLAEEFCRKLMVCYHRLDRRADALFVYDCCQQMLAAAFGIEPCPETKAIQKALLSEEQSKEAEKEGAEVEDSHPSILPPPH